MGATNTTTYYNLSQFVGTDKPAWLQDYNGDMLKIDTGINAAKVAADNAANAASAAQGDATTALGDIASLNTTVGTISGTLNTAVGNINTINSLIGNGTPTTTDQTIIGAINELNVTVASVKNKYVIRGESIITGVVADGVKTVSQLLDELHSALQSAVSSFPNGVSVEPLFATIPGFANCKFDDIVALNNASVLPTISLSAVGYNDSVSTSFIQSVNLKSVGSTTMAVYIDTATASISSATGIDANVPASGTHINIVGNILDLAL